jgi:tetratricopeptide (TPR) repeat protein
MSLDPHRQQAEAAFQAGLAKLKQGDYHGANADFDRTIALAPHFPEPFMYRGALKIHHLDDLLGGIADCTEALRLLPNRPMPHANRGMAYIKLSQYGQAVADFHIALQHDPLNGNLHRIKAYAHYELEQYAQAVIHYSHALKFFHDEALPHAMRGVCYHYLHDFDKALTDFNRALILNPHDSGAYSNRGVLYTTLRQYDAALADHNRALHLKEAAGYYSNRGLLYMLQGAVDLAQADCDQALLIDAQQGDVYGLRGQLRFLAGDWPGALADFKHIEHLKKRGDKSALAGQAIVYQALGETGQAQLLWQQLLRKHPEYSDLAWLREDLLVAEPLWQQVEQIVAALP